MAPTFSFEWATRSTQLDLTRSSRPKHNASHASIVSNLLVFFFFFSLSLSLSLSSGVGVGRGCLFCFSYGLTETSSLHFVVVFAGFKGPKMATAIFVRDRVLLLLQVHHHLVGQVEVIYFFLLRVMLGYTWLRFMTPLFAKAGWCTIRVAQRPVKGVVFACLPYQGGG